MVDLTLWISFKQLPNVLENGDYTLHAEGTNGVIFNTSKTIKLSKKDKSMFIQSDKAIYKPGDKGKSMYSAPYDF